MHLECPSIEVKLFDIIDRCYYSDSLDSIGVYYECNLRHTPKFNDTPIECVSSLKVNLNRTQNTHLWSAVSAWALFYYPSPFNYNFVNYLILAPKFA